MEAFLRRVTYSLNRKYVEPYTDTNYFAQNITVLLKSIQPTIALLLVNIPHR